MSQYLCSSSKSIKSTSGGNKSSFYDPKSPEKQGSWTGNSIFATDSKRIVNRVNHVGPSKTVINQYLEAQKSQSGGKNYSSFHESNLQQAEPY